MKKRFVISMNPSTTEQDRAFIEFLKSRGVGWWHWLSETWLVVDPHGSLTSATIRDALLTIYPGNYTLVLEFRADCTDSWHGFGPAKDPRNMFTWIKENWNR